MNAEKEGEKRSQEDELEMTRENSKPKRLRKTEEEKLPEGLEYEGGRKKTDDELTEEWKERIKDREEKLMKEDAERSNRIEKAKRMQK